MKDAVTMSVKYSAQRCRNHTPTPSVSSKAAYTRVTALTAWSVRGADGGIRTHNLRFRSSSARGPQPSAPVFLRILKPCPFPQAPPESTAVGGFGYMVGYMTIVLRWRSDA